MNRITVMYSTNTSQTLPMVYIVRGIKSGRSLCRNDSTMNNDRAHSQKSNVYIALTIICRERIVCSERMYIYTLPQTKQKSVSVRIILISV